MANELLADSDFFIALYKSDDANHEAALGMLEKIGEQGANLALSVFAYSEIATVLSQRVGKNTARDFMKDAAISGVRILYMTDFLFEKAKETFLRQRSKNVSFTDAGNIVLAAAYGFDAIVSFDSDYKKNGLRLFGRP